MLCNLLFYCYKFIVHYFNSYHILHWLNCRSFNGLYWARLRARYQDFNRPLSLVSNFIFYTRTFGLHLASVLPTSNNENDGNYWTIVFQVCRAPYPGFPWQDPGPRKPSFLSRLHWESGGNGLGQDSACVLSLPRDSPVCVPSWSIVSRLNVRQCSLDCVHVSWKHHLHIGQPSAPSLQPK